MTKIRQKRIAEFLFIFLAVTFLSTPVFGLKNPAAVYCEALGYEYVIETWINGGQIGICKLPNNERVDAWAFLRGKVAQEYSYCKEKGYGIKSIKDKDVCSSIYSSTCAVCVLKDGKEVEVTELMNLSFEEGVCGDKICAIGEDFETCPEDCPSGGEDGYCDGILDGVCDQDCKTEEDPDCNTKYICGNDICEPNENSRSCAIDCIFGGKDDYCDAFKDGICDPDCEKGLDPDCEKVKEEGGQNFYIILGIVLILVIGLVILISIFLKKKRRKPV